MEKGQPDKLGKWFCIIACGAIIATFIWSYSQLIIDIAGYGALTDSSGQ
jgi:hypothetical protein